MAIDLKSSVQFMVKSAMDIRYHRIHLRAASGVLESIERHQGKLGRVQRRRCDEYAIEVLGDKRYVPWLYVYTAVSGEFKEGWIPDNYYGAVVVPKINGAYSEVAPLKSLASVIFQSELFPDVLSYVNGVYFDPRYQRVAAEDVKDLLFKDGERICFKLDSSIQGKGVQFFDRDTFSLEAIERLGDGIFQTPIQQHPELAKFAENSVATFRVTTVYTSKDEVSVRACFLRFGTGGDTHVQTASSIKVTVDLQTGAFHDVGYTPEWIAVRTHPTSGLTFAGSIVPNFSGCLEAVRELHGKVPYIGCIGWDVAVNREGNIQIMEWNARHNGIKFTEATQGPCFADLGWEKLASRNAS